MDAEARYGVQLLILAFGDRPLDGSEREWLESEVLAAFRATSSSKGDPSVVVYEETLDDDAVRTLEKKRGPATGSGWRGFYDLAGLDGGLPEDEVLDAAKFLADRSRRKVIVPLVVEAHGGAASLGRREGISAGPKAPLADFWETEAKKHEPLARDIRRALHARWFNN